MYTNPFRYLFEALVTTKKPIGDNIHIAIDTIHHGHHLVTYKGIRCLKCPFDYVIYQMLLWQIKPDLIIEIGTLTGGGTLYLADILDTIGKGIIHSIDIKDQSEKIVKKHKRIKLFYEGWEKYDTTNLKKKFKKILVIDDGAHVYEQVRDALEKFAPLVSKNSYYLVEDGIVSYLKAPLKYHGGPNRAIDDFLQAHPEFVVDRKWCDMFGTNATFNINGYLKRL